MPVPPAFDLSGRVAVVTGAGAPDGIGFATARLLAELGAAVTITATTARIRDRVSELRGAGFSAAGMVGDLTDVDVAPGLVSAALEQWGLVIDIVVNNAGMISAANPVFESGTVVAMDLATWHAGLALQPDLRLPGHQGGAAGHDEPQLGAHHHGGQRDRPGDGDPR